MTATIEQRLAVAGDRGGFDETEIVGLDEPVRRYFRAAIAPGTPRAPSATLRMRGSIKFGHRWVPFRASEVLAPLHGYHWPARVAGGLLSGSDTCVDGDATMVWKLLGLVPVIRSTGPDVAKSAIGRAAIEGIWLPTALLPRYGVAWHAEDEEHLVANMTIGHDLVTLQLTIDEDGHVRTAHLDRWSDPDGTGTFEWVPFGVEATANRTFPCGITIPADGTGGWFHQTDRWGDGEFMRYSISDVVLDVTPPGNRAHARNPFWAAQRPADSETTLLAADGPRRAQGLDRKASRMQPPSSDASAVAARPRWRDLTTRFEPSRSSPVEPARAGVTADERALR